MASGSTNQTDRPTHRSIGIYVARSQLELLEALKKCIGGHKAILECGILPCDISPSNVGYNGMLFDFDQSAILKPDGSSGAYHRGTRPFKAIGVLLGEENSFMHDLESFFWVLFWVCVYGEERVIDQRTIQFVIDHRIVLRFDKWWYMDYEDLAKDKEELVNNEDDFLRTARENFHSHFQSLIPWVNELRKILFPQGIKCGQLDKSLYETMQEVLEEAQKDPRCHEPTWLSW